MTCIIVDDEPFAREGMLMNVKETPFLTVVGEFGNALEANNFLSQNDVDLMFLDIEMPGVNGLDFIRNLVHRPLIILTTAYPQYALESYELDTVDYLLKPIRLDRFIKAVNKAQELHELLQMAQQQAISGVEQDYLYIKSERKFVKLFFKDIVFIKGMKDYVVVHTAREKVITALNIKSIAEQLPPAIFARVSKSHLVNIRFIQAIDHDFIQLHALQDEIPLGDAYREDFIQRYVKTNLISKN
ncbi:MAG: response regulator transcription factor [Lewinellaceae bacterium]|nr:response regulator transcription factor [Lewinellaceae bacterium]